MGIENSENRLTKLLHRVQDDKARTLDVIYPTDQLQYVSNNEPGQEVSPKLILEQAMGVPTTELSINSVAFDQISSRAGIDVRTARRLQTNYPQEYGALINKTFEREPAARLVRAHMTNGNTGVARAFLSSKFKTFDNADLLESALPQLIESDADWQVVHGTVTDKRLYLRLKSDRFTGEGAAVGDMMALGIGLSNSEVGLGSVSVFQMVWTLACLNGMQTANRHRSSHITSARGDTDTWEMLTDEAKNADNKALALKVRDLVGNYGSRDALDTVLEKMRYAAADHVEGSIHQATENLGKVLQLTKADTSKVLDGLLATIGQSGYSGQPVSRATMVNAVTAVAHQADPDSVDDWQRLGGRVLDLPARDWQRVAAAA